MTKYSDIYFFNGRAYRYDFTNGIVEWVFENGDGIYEPIVGAGLMKENWLDKGMRDEYLFEFGMDLDAETDSLMEDLMDELCI